MLTQIRLCRVGRQLVNIPYSWWDLIQRSTSASPLPAHKVAVSLEGSRERTRRRPLVAAVMVMRRKSEYVMSALGFVIGPNFVGTCLIRDLIFVTWVENKVSHWGLSKNVVCAVEILNCQDLILIWSLSPDEHVNSVYPGNISQVSQANTVGNIWSVGYLVFWKLALIILKQILNLASKLF